MLDRLYLAARRFLWVRRVCARFALPSGSACELWRLKRIGSHLPSGSAFSVGALDLRRICVTKRLGVRILAFETFRIASTERLGVVSGCVGSALDLVYQAARLANSGV